MTELLLRNPDLRRQAAQLLQDWAPGLGALADGTGDTAVLAQQQVDELEAFARDLSTADVQDGGGELAARVETELRHADAQSLSGQSFLQATDTLSTRMRVWAGSAANVRP
jgi:hypothetical protein